ncbi:MAG TPA: hypothetical protein VEV61_14175 [Streptosporangiaceae bacterium]|nr:hypothetical protein [Streptosporangiaceae bacterium]
MRAGTSANFAVWVWSTKANSTGVQVRIHIGSAKSVDSPKFTVCPVTNSATCNVGNLPRGQADELQVAVKVQGKAPLGEQVKLFARATAPRSLAFEASASDTVVRTPVADQSTPPTVALPPGSFPPISGSGISPSNPAGLFPTVPGTPSTSPSGGSLGLPPANAHHTVHAAEASATVPMDARLIGGQLAGLAVLAGAVAIAIARLSLRTQKPQEDGGNPKAADKA